MHLTQYITLNYPVSDTLESQYKIEVKLKTFGDYREKKNKHKIFVIRS